MLEWNPHILDVLKATGKEIWCYSMFGRLRNHGSLFYDYYRLQAWKINKYGLDGGGFWVWFRDDPFVNPNVGDIVYVDGGILMSRNWEAYREGLEDNKYLNLLRVKIAALQALGGHAAVAAGAEQLITDAIKDVTDKFDDPTRADVWRELIAEKIIEIEAILSP